MVLHGLDGAQTQGLLGGKVALKGLRGSAR